MDASVESVLDGYPLEFKKPLLQIRDLICAVARDLPEVGAIEETLKWGQPTYTTIKKKNGFSDTVGSLW